MKTAIAALEHELQVTHDRATVISNALRALRELAGDPAQNGRRPPAQKPAAVRRGAKVVKATAAAPNKQGPRYERMRLTPQLLETARLIAERDGLMAAASATGASYSGLYTQAKKLGWKLPPRGKAGKAAAKWDGKLPATCPKCHMRTPVDPCGSCGKKLG